MNSNEISEFVELLNEEDFNSLFHEACRKFNYAGTYFQAGDVESAVDSWLDDMGEEVTPEFVAQVVAKVMGGYYYTRAIADRTAEVGNELIADAVSEAITELRKET